MFLLDSVLITLIPEMGTTTDAGMMDGPAPTTNTQSRLVQPRPVQRVNSRGSSIAEGNGGDREREREEP